MNPSGKWKYKDLFGKRFSRILTIERIAEAKGFWKCGHLILWRNSLSKSASTPSTLSVGRGVWESEEGARQAPREGSPVSWDTFWQTHMAVPFNSFQKSSRFFPLTAETEMASHRGSSYRQCVCSAGLSEGVQEMEWCVEKIIPALSCRTLFSKAGSNWLRTIIASHLFLFWLISFLFLFHLHVC